MNKLPRKTYCIDTGLQHALSATAVPDERHQFENLVFLVLRRRHRQLYYFDDGVECDFVAFDGKQAQTLVQATWQLESDNLERECTGLRHAMQAFGLPKAGWSPSGRRTSFPFPKEKSTSSHSRNYK
ncbi:MAG: ATP-binding protein [Victivallales bacterium]|nr:ATP-binding protein [Victivallales bacterium]